MSGSTTAPTRRPALSPSRAADFRRCALLYRFRVVDRLPEAPSPAAVRGTAVHAVLERLFALPADARRPERLAPLAADVVAGLDPEEAAVLGEGAADAVAALAGRYFALEDPRSVEPEGCEVVLEADGDGAAATPLRGIVDRLDPVAGGGLRVVDYKTGAAPPVPREVRALFAMRFYALMLWRARGVVPELRLMYLADGAVLTLRPTADELARFTRTLDAVWAAVRRAAPTGEFRPNPGPGCAWCDHQARCPAFGGTPPPYPGWPADADGTPEGTRAPGPVMLPLPAPPPRSRAPEETRVSDPEMEPFFRLLPPVRDDPQDATRVLATASTAGPWFPDGQHMGPPSALLVRALERCEPRDEVRLARLTVEVLGRVPMGELTVHAAVERAGRTIELVGAELRAQGRAVARAHGWRLAIGDTAAAATPPTTTLDPPDAGRAIPTPSGWLPGYLDALEWRWLRGHLGESGPGAAWARLRVPVVEGEEPTPWQRLAAVADSTNGAAARLDLTEWLFVNTDLTLHLHRAPEGEWIGLDADSVIGPDGAGTAFSLLHDRHGPVGRAAQALTVRPR